MAENKTQPTGESVETFINRIPDEQKRQDSLTVLNLMQTITGIAPRMWGDSIVGFGSYHYTYASGRQGDWFVIGFSPRKQNLTLYLSCGLKPPQATALLKNLGKHKIGVGCIYINKLQDVNLDVLKELMQWAAQQNLPGV